ncbi:MAG: 1-deoxy-D-xylulose-5-phosphate synthase, partial [Ruminococcaceae bacterium]|nr:1-deoxy-D-xylulose-5-phosphate synthase [Oscillospiraceae bacterium]
MLDKITSPNDIKNLKIDELERLAGEIRAFLVEHVSKTGGHLASNLGIVEITLALHKVFSSETDRLIFDVGHQSYVHKILTGRKDQFTTLRQYGGLSGFLRPDESVHDACVSGHASNSVSVALGMARARTLSEQDYSVVAIIGDGALTGGLAYEALNDAGQSDEPLIVILNDNNMSITKNVGAMNNYLARLRLRPRYLRYKGIYHKLMRKLPFGKPLDRFLSRIKDSIRRIFLNSSIFEDMGFVFLGPADGHDLKYVVYLLELARELHKPVLIHLTTTKGKGYTHSEENPQNFHGISQFDVDSGKPVRTSNHSFSKNFGESLCNLAKSDSRICAITAAMSSGVGLGKFAEAYPKRFFDVGIAEGHAVAMAAGLAKQGMIPVCAIYSTFLQRAYDMLIHDVSISNLHVVFAIDRAGLVGEDGETHHGVFDVGFMRQVPGITILCPANYAEQSAMLSYAIQNVTGPVALRYPRGEEQVYTANSFSEFQPCVRLREGEHVTLISYGVLINHILETATLAEKNGISCEVYKLNSITAFDLDALAESVSKTKRLSWW